MQRTHFQLPPIIGVRGILSRELEYEFARGQRYPRPAFFLGKSTRTSKNIKINNKKKICDNTLLLV
jgi:hypothetical protein